MTYKGEDGGEPTTGICRVAIDLCRIVFDLIDNVNFVVGTQEELYEEPEFEDYGER